MIQFKETRKLIAFRQLDKIDIFALSFSLFFIFFITARRKDDFGTFVENAPFYPRLTLHVQELTKSLQIMLTRPSHKTPYFS